MEIIVGGFVLIILFAMLQSAAQNQGLKKNWDKARKPNFPNAYGQAHFITDDEARKAGLLTGKGLWLGLSKISGKVLRHCGDSHVTALGSTGIGKGRDWLVALILELGPRTAIVNDPKGQLMCLTYKARERVGASLALNPFNLHMQVAKGVKQVRYNPLTPLRADDPSLGIKCDKIADGLVLESGNAEDRFFNDGGKGLLSGIMMRLVESGTPDQKNLTFMCDILNGDIYGFARDALSNTNNPYVRMRLAPFAVDRAWEDRTITSFVQTARTHTQFIRNEIIGESLRGSDFTFKQLREKPATLYIVLPADASSDVFDHYYRLVAASAMAEVLSEECLGKTPVTFVLDESGQMGRMASILQAMSIARGYGVQLVNVFTDFPSLKRIYGEGARSFLANSHCNLFFGASEVETAEEASRMSGQKEVVTRTQSVVRDRQTNEPIVTEGANQTGVPLIRMEDVLNLPEDELLVFLRGRGVLRCKRKPYWKTHPGKTGKDPYEKGKKRW